MKLLTSAVAAVIEDPAGRVLLCQQSAGHRLWTLPGGKIKLGDIHLETTDGKKLVLSRVARPDAEQTRILSALKLQFPERLSPDRLL